MKAAQRADEMALMQVAELVAELVAATVDLSVQTTAVTRVALMGATRVVVRVVLMADWTVGSTGEILAAGSVDALAMTKVDLSVKATVVTRVGKRAS